MLGDYLYEFAVVVRSGTMSGAAQRLGLSQSALARHIAALETSLDAQLLERTPTGVRLTDEGRFAYDAASQIADLADQLRQGFSAEARPNRGNDGYIQN